MINLKFGTNPANDIYNLKKISIEFFFPIFKPNAGKEMFKKKYKLNPSCLDLLNSNFFGGSKTYD